MRKAFLFAALLAAASPAMAADNAMADNAMKGAANDFLAVYGSFHPSDGIPDAAGRARLTPVLSARLNKMLADGDAAEKRFADRNKKAPVPPLIEGDLFTSMFEGATAWKVQDCAGDGKTGHCTLALTHSDPKQKPVQWTDTLLLVATASGWRVDDVRYGGGFQFGNTGRLSDTLGQVLMNVQ